MKESKLQDIVRKLMTRAGFKVLNVHGHLMQEPGWPDLMGFHRRGLLLAELKVGDAGLRPSQKIIFDHLRKRDWNPVVIRGYAADKTLHCYDIGTIPWTCSPPEFLKWVTPLLLRDSYREP